jgi:hypothetical protein
MNIICPKCYRYLSVSDWETDNKYTYYRCPKECCEIQFTNTDNTCVLYSFSFAKLPYFLVGCNAPPGYNTVITAVTKEPSLSVIIVEISEFIPVKFDHTLPSQAEKIYKRLMKLRVFS